MFFDIVLLLQKLVACRSVTPFDDGIMKVIAEETAELGFKSKIFKFADDKEEVLNIYSHLNPLNKNKKNLCFVGHLDVVPSGDEKLWKYHPFCATTDDGIIYGRGVVDMKGAIAAFIHAIHDISFYNPMILQQINLSMMLTGDEEGVANNGIKKLIPILIKEEKVKIDACIIGEPVSREKLGDNIKVGARGSATFFLNIFGRQGHVAYHKYADNPLTKISKVISVLENCRLSPQDENFEASNMEMTNISTDNRAENVIPANVSMQFNVRYGDKHTAVSLFSEYNSLLAEAFHPDEFSFSYRTSGDSFLSRSPEFSQMVAQSIEKITGFTPEINTKGGTSDGRFLYKYCPIVEVGLSGATAHQINESVSEDDLLLLSKIYKQIIIDYATKN